MTHVIRVRNVEGALGEGFQHLKICGLSEPSRNGPVRVAPGPVVTEYRCPQERVLFNPERDANPVFHLLEAIWMFAGRGDAEFLLPYNARMSEYAEPHGIIHGAYGPRWRNWFGLDQIKAVIDMVRATPSTRRAVIQMWSATSDLNTAKNDLPCNTTIYFTVRDNMEFKVLDMTVCCRSNDILWGAYGANAVHFSMLQELIASSVGVCIGTYYQFSNNFHAYSELPIVKKWLDSPPFYESAVPYPYKMIPMLLPSESYEDFIADCVAITNGLEGQGLRTSFMHRVVVPLKSVYDMRKAGSRTWKVAMEGVAECDWKDAFRNWANRRENGNESK